MDPSPQAETDPRFPSGKWVGFFVDRRLPGRHDMELNLNFANGTMIGAGRDRVGLFTIDGAYDTTDGNCKFAKHYIARHTVMYRGFNEGKGIWGTWQLSDAGLTFTGGFHIWPEGMSDPTQPKLDEEADIPLDAGAPEREEELLPVGR